MATFMLQRDMKRDHVEILRYFPGRSEMPVSTTGMAVEQLIDLVDDPADIDAGMAGEDLGKAVGQIAGKAFSGPSGKMKFK